MEVWIARNAGVRTLGNFYSESAKLNLIKINFLGEPKPR